MIDLQIMRLFDPASVSLNNIHQMKARFLITALPLAFAVGCATSPDPTERELLVEAPDNWSAEAATDSAATVPVPGTPGWLHQFNDPKLNTVVEDALERNLDLQAAIARLDAARANARISEADQFPQLGAGLAGSRREFIFDESTDPPSTLTSNSYGFSLDLSWEVDVWGRLRDSASASIADYEAAAADLAGARLSLAGNTAKFWFRATTAHQQLDLANETVSSFESTVDLVRSRFESGISSSLELRLALANAAAARALKQKRAQELEQSVRALEVVVGTYPENALGTVDELPELNQSVPAGLPSELLNRRPDIAAAERRLAAADRRVSSAKKSLLPSLRLTGSAGTASQDLSNIVDADYSVWSLVGGLTQPLFQGGRLRANVERSKADAERIYFDYSKTILTAFQEVENALAAEKYLFIRETELFEAAIQSDGAQRLAEDEYAAGLIEIITVLESQRRALNAKEAYLSVRELRLRNRVDLHLALGGDFGERATVAAN
ncbi:MAG: transporter [Verrucomicrobia bacterium]|nr:MAG: transporter [Verrucomicrobiota bacterium]